MSQYQITFNKASGKPPIGLVANDLAHAIALAQKFVSKGESILSVCKDNEFFKLTFDYDQLEEWRKQIVVQSNNITGE